MSYRVVQSGTGNIGYHGLRHVIEHPAFDLVGMHAHSPEKIEKNAGEVAGPPRRPPCANRLPRPVKRASQATG